MIEVNEAQCAAIGERLRRQTIRPDEFLFVPASLPEARGNREWECLAKLVAPDTVQRIRESLVAH